MAIILKKNSTDISSSVDMKSVSLTSVLTKEVGRLQFKIINYGTKSTVALGDQIDLYEGSTHLFGGTLTEKEDIIEGGIITATRYTANDWSFRLNARLVTKSYANMDPHDILLDMVANFTDGTFTTTNVQTGGFNVTSIKFNYESFTVAFEKLAKLIGWEWFVDADKDIHFFPPNTVVTAPYDIDDSSGNLEWVTLDIDQSLINMKNSITVIGGIYTKTYNATTTPDQYVTNGTTSVYPLAYTYDPTTIVVTLDGAGQSVGTDQVTDPLTVQVLYNNASRFIRFTTPPGTGKTVKIYGNAQIPILANVKNQSAIAQYGLIEDIIIDQNIKSITEAQDRGNAQISQYGSPVYAIRFSTLKTGFIVGQTVRVNSAKLGSNVLVVIKRITGRMYSPTQMHYDIECVGTEKVNFIDIMKVLLTQATANTVVSDSTVLQVLLLFSETVSSSDTLKTPTTTSGPYNWGAGSNVGKWNFFTWS